MIYFDNAATTVTKPKEVVDAVVNAMEHMGNPARGAYEGALAASRTVFHTRQKIAEMFGCRQSDHVVFTANSTEALNIAIMGTIAKSDHVISTDLEHNSVLRPLYYLEDEQEVDLDFVRSDKNGNINYNDFESLMQPNTTAVVCTHASNLTGNMLDLKRIGEIAHDNGALLIVDASQTAGVKHIDMEEMNIDVLCFTGHKGLMGPQGTGGLCIREGVEIRPLLRGGTGIHSFDWRQPSPYPTRLEAGTLNGHGIAGLCAAIDYIDQTGLSVIDEKEKMLMQRFYNGVKDIDGVKIYGDFSSDRCAIVSLNIRDYASRSSCG